MKNYRTVQFKEFATLNVPAEQLTGGAAADAQADPAGQATQTVAPSNE